MTARARLLVVRFESDAPAYPSLEATAALIRLAAARDLPALGICLGGQLAAHALGGRAYRSPRGPEYGWGAAAARRVLPPGG